MPLLLQYSNHMSCTLSFVVVANQENRQVSCVCCFKTEKYVRVQFVCFVLQFASYYVTKACLGCSEKYVDI